MKGAPVILPKPRIAFFQCGDRTLSVSTGQSRDTWRATGKELDLVELGDFPRRIAEHGVEPAVLHDFGEREVPVQESVPEG